MFVFFYVQPNNEAGQSLSLPKEENNFPTAMARRHSEFARTRTATLPVTTCEIDVTDSSHIRLDYIKKRKKNVDSIVASDLSGGN